MVKTFIFIFGLLTFICFSKDIKRELPLTRETHTSGIIPPISLAVTSSGSISIDSYTMGNSAG